MLKEFCEECNDIVELKLKEEISEQEIKGKKYNYLKLIGYCNRCGNIVTTNKIIDKNLKRIDEAYRAEENIISNDEIY